MDDVWSLDILDLKDYGREYYRGYRYVLVVFDNFSKFGWTVPIKYKNCQTLKDEIVFSTFENLLISSKIKFNRN